MKLIRSLRIQALFIFLFISVLIVSTWFRNGVMYGGAEVGIFTFNPERWFEMSKYVWWDVSAPGQLIPQFIVGIPLYFFFILLKSVGLSPQNIQQVFFTIVFFLMGFGVFLLSFDIFDKSRKKYSLVAGLFYIFNAYTLVQVWHRFVYSTIILAAVLPFLILFWKKWISEGRVIHLVIFLFINFLSVYIFGNLAAIITIWIALLFVSVGEAIFPWQGKINVRKICQRVLVGFVFWLFTNVWWILPTFSIAPATLPQQHSSEDNLGTLVVISRQTIMPYLLQLANPYYLFLNSELGLIYSNFIFKIIPWIASFIVFLGLMSSLKEKRYAKYSVIFIGTIILAKGAAAPFSYPYILAFNMSYFLGVLRNPFEKLGIMLPLFGAILFALGLRFFLSWGVKHIGSTVIKLSLLLVLAAVAIYCFPFIGGKFFGTQKFPVKVSIPKSYEEADKWLKNQQIDQGVILHLPFSGKDVVTYKWKDGYHGVDPNELLFTGNPSLSRSVGIKRIDDTLSSITYIFTSSFSKDHAQILKLLQSLNVKYIVLHKDIDWGDKDTYGDKGSLLDPNSLEAILNNLDFLKKKNHYGSLIIYEVVDEDFRPILTISKNIQIVYPGESNIMQILSKTKDGGDIITPLSGQIDNAILQRASQAFIFPNKKIASFESSPSAVIANANDIFGKLLEIRNYSTSVGILHSLDAINELISATQKLTKISSLAAMSEYKLSINNFFNKYKQDLNVYMLFNSYIADVLKLHLVVLKQIGDQEISKIIEEKMVKLEILPQYKTTGQIFKFQVPVGRNYGLLLNSQDKNADIKINGTKIASNSSVVNSQGNFEISYNSGANFLAEDIILNLRGIDELTSSGSTINFKKDNPVSYSGSVHLERAEFINFAQSFHSGWILTLAKEGQFYEIKDHFLSNLFGNAWWVDRTGDFEFKIEFIPQKNVSKGFVVSLAAGIFLSLITMYTYLRRFIKK